MEKMVGDNHLLIVCRHRLRVEVLAHPPVLRASAFGCVLQHIAKLVKFRESQGTVAGFHAEIIYPKARKGKRPLHFFSLFCLTRRGGGLAVKGSSNE